MISKERAKRDVAGEGRRKCRDRGRKDGDDVDRDLIRQTKTCLKHCEICGRKGLVVGFENTYGGENTAFAGDAVD